MSRHELPIRILAERDKRDFELESEIREKSLKLLI